MLSKQVKSILNNKQFMSTYICNFAVLRFFTFTYDFKKCAKFRDKRKKSRKQRNLIDAKIKTLPL